MNTNPKKEGQLVLELFDAVGKQSDVSHQQVMPLFILSHLPCEAQFRRAVGSKRKKP